MKFLFVQTRSHALEQRPRLARLVWRIEAAFMHVLWWLLRALGPERAAGLGARFLGFFGPRSPKKAALVRRQLRVIEPEADAARIEALARRSWQSLGMVFGEYPHLERIARSGRIELVDHAGLERYGAGRRSAVFFGAHYANWELLALAIARAGVPMIALYAPIANPWLDALMARARRQLGCGTHARGDSIRPLLRHLRGGGCVGSLVDLRVEDGAELPFFGHPVRLPTTAARLARRTGADLVPMHAERTGRARYRVHAGPVLAPAEDADPERAVRATTERMVALLEDWIRADPALWLLANRRWDKRLLDPSRAAPAAPRTPVADADQR